MINCQQAIHKQPITTHLTPSAGHPMFQHRPRSIVIPPKNWQRQGFRHQGAVLLLCQAILGQGCRQVGTVLPWGQATLGQGCRQRGEVFRLGNVLLGRQQGAVLHLCRGTLSQSCRQRGAVLVLGQASRGQECRLQGAVLPLGQAILIQGTLVRIGVSARNPQRRLFRQQGVVLPVWVRGVGSRAQFYFWARLFWAGVFSCVLEEFRCYPYHRKGG